MVRRASYGPQPGRGGQPQGGPARRTEVSWEGGWASRPCAHRAAEVVGAARSWRRPRVPAPLRARPSAAAELPWP